MAKQLFTNNAEATLAAPIAPSDVSITLDSGQGALFASPTGGDWQLATIDLGASKEVVKITGRAGDVLTVVRGQEGTSAVSASAGATIEGRVTAGTMASCQRNMSQASGALAIGHDPSGSYSSAAADGGCTAYGLGATASGPSGTALGFGAQANGNSALAVGVYAKAIATHATGVGGYAYAESATAVGPDATNWTAWSWRIAGMPCLQRDDWWFGSGAEMYASAEANFATPWVDLGNGAPWAATTVYKDGDVVVPTTPNGKQYHLWHGSYDAQAKPNQFTSGSTEPTWPTTAGDSVTESGNDWICLDAANGFEMSIPAEMVFYPSEIGFICFNHANVSAAPYVSVGVTGTPGAFVNNQQLTGITGANQRQAFTGFKDGVTTAMTFKVNTPAAGTNSKFHGRFYVKGTFIQKQG